MKKDDLISRAEAIEALSTPCDKRYRHGVWETCLDNIKTAIRNIPAVDAVPVVRCKDCKHRIVNENAGKKGYLALEAMCALDTNDPYELGRNAEDPDWFCADGERRDDDAAD